jgi:YD repeat-containing protein
MNKKRLYAALLVAIMIFLMIPFAIAENVADPLANLTEESMLLQYLTGTYKGFTYYYDTKTGKLFIRGTGKMPNFENEKAPWAIFASSATQVVLSEGITSISANAFEGFTELKTVTIPETVTEIAGTAFAECESIEEVEFTGKAEVLQALVADIPALAEVPVTEIEASVIEEQITAVEVAYVEQEQERMAETLAAVAPVVTAKTYNKGDDNDDGGSSAPAVEPIADVVTYKYEPRGLSLTVRKEINGNLAFVERVNGNGSNSNYTGYYSRVVYDGDVAVQEIITYIGQSGPDSCIQMVTDFTYDSEGRFATVTESYGSNKNVYTYSYDGDTETETMVAADGQKTVTVWTGEHEYSSKSYRKDGTLYREETSVLNSDGTVTETRWTYNSSSSTDKRTTTLTYNDQGKVTLAKGINEYSSGYSNTVSTSEETYSYDADGNLVKQVVTNSEKSSYSGGESTYTSGYEYNYTYSGGILASCDYTSTYNDQSYSTNYSFAYSDNLIATVTVTDSNNRKTATNVIHTGEAITGLEAKTTDSDGVVQETRKTTASLDDNGNATGEVIEVYNSNGALISKNVYANINGRRNLLSSSSIYDGRSSELNYEYDEQGNQISNSTINKDSSGKETYRSVGRSTYDANGVQTGYSSESYSNGVLQSKSKSTYVNGIQSTYSSESYQNGVLTGSYTSTYDADGRQIKSTSESYNAEGVLTSAYSSSLINGQMRETYNLNIWTDGDGITRKNEMTYTYADDGTATSVINRYAGNTLTYDGVAAYDAKHNKISESGTNYDDNGTLTGSSKNTYEYDADGRQVKNTYESYNTAGELTYEQAYVIDPTTHQWIEGTETWYHFDNNTYTGKTVQTFANGEYTTVEYDANDNPIIPSNKVDAGSGGVY